MTNKLIAIDFGALIQEATPNLSTSTTPGDLVSVGVALFFPIAGFVLLGYLIYMGFMYMTSAGDPKKTVAAQQGITYAIAGFVVITASYIIASYFGLALRLNQLSQLFGGVG